MSEYKPSNPVILAARWAAKEKPPPQKETKTNYSHLADILGVRRQVVQRYKQSGRFPPDHIPTLVEASKGELTEEDLKP